MQDDYPFNDDLLISEEDRGQAAVRYGPILFALYFPQLVRKVEQVDDTAKAARARVRRLGLRGIWMVTVSLIAASSAPLYHEYHPWSDLVVLAAAILGIAGGLIGLGVFSAGAKARWLENRLISECLRQLHFRTLIAMAPEILAAASSGDPLDFEENPTPAFTHFDQKRIGAFDEFNQDIVRRVKEELGAIVKPDNKRPTPEITPLPDPGVFALPHGALLLQAYGRLRIRRQMQFADHKLLKKGGLFSSFPRVQAETLGRVGFSCVILLLVLHILSALMSLSEQWQAIVRFLDLIAIWIALLALALRSVEEGLKPHAEVERYLHYQATIERILDRYDTAETAGKLRAAVAMEHAAYDEMVIFLRSHHDSRYWM